MGNENNIFVQETKVNAVEDRIFDESPIYMSYTDNVGDLFQSCQRELGRCTSSVYLDFNGETIRIGWVFEKLEEYSDCREKYLQQTWVTLFDKTNDGFTYRELEKK